MIKVFISQPMNGKSNSEIVKERNRIKDSLLKWNDNLCFIDSLLPECSFGPVYCLGESIKLMEDADIVVFAPGWENARGCRIEHRVCEEYNIYYMEI